MSPPPCEVFDSVAMLPSSLTSLFEPIGGAFQPAEGCDLQSSPASLQAVCDSLTGPVNSNTQMRTTLMQHDPACSLHAESWVYPTFTSRERVKHPFNALSWFKHKHFIHSFNSAFVVFSLKTLSSHMIFSSSCSYFIWCSVWTGSVKIDISLKIDV